MKLTTALTLTTCLLGTGLLGSAHAEGFEPARFIASKCSTCHDSSVYSRSNRRVKSLPALERQVRMCDANIGTKLFDDDVHSLVQYLNDSYYHFQK